MVQNKEKNSVLVLIDEPYETDYKVLRSIKKYENPILVNCKEVEVSSIFGFSQAITQIFLTFFYLIFYWKILHDKYTLQPKGVFSGWKKSITFDIKSRLIAKKFLKEHNNISKIHSHDLFCSLTAKELSKKLQIPLIYDAHEVEFHRNRKNGLLRVVYDIVLEKEVVKRAIEVIVVNQPIKRLYMDLYNIDDSKITVVNNNHFTPYVNYALDHFNSKVTTASIVYVGGGIFGRQLEKLTQEAQRCNMMLHGFFIGDIPDFAKSSPWILGDKEYINDLLALAKQKRLAMWCCTDDICLSYKLSLPNKFFQAIAVGIPIIAAKDTYLADLVLEYHIGFIYDGGNFDEISSEMQSDRVYTTLLESVAAFQKKIYIDNLVL